MSDRRFASVRIATEGLKYARAADAKAAETFEFSTTSLGQRNPQHCPQRALGRPMAIREVAALLGCSPWTVRQRLMPAGLPHFRASRAGKLVFFENQIVRWILDRQREKGGHIR